MAAPRYLILGAGGIVGRNLFRRLGPEAAVATYHRHPFPGGVHFDAVTMRLADTLLAEHRGFTHAFVLLGNTNIDACAADPTGTAAVNVTGMVRAIDDLVAAGIVPVFASSDGVFSGTRGLWTEADPPAPILTYGHQKLAVERHLAGLRAPSLTVRLAKVVSADPREEQLFTHWHRSLKSGTVLREAVDQTFSPVDVEDVVGSLLSLTEGGHRGLFHLGGPKAYTRRALFDVFFAALAQREPSLQSTVVDCRIGDFPFAEPRPLNASLSSQKLVAAIGTQPADMESVCRRFADRAYPRPPTS